MSPISQIFRKAPGIHKHDFVVKSQKQRGFTLVIKSKCRHCGKKIEETLA